MRIKPSTVKLGVSAFTQNLQHLQHFWAAEISSYTVSVLQYVSAQFVELHPLHSDQISKVEAQVMTSRHLKSTSQKKVHVKYLIDYGT